MAKQSKSREKQAKKVWSRMENIKKEGIQFKSTPLTRPKPGGGGGGCGGAGEG